MTDRAPLLCYAYEVLTGDLLHGREVTGTTGPEGETVTLSFADGEDATHGREDEMAVKRRLTDLGRRA